eukprot:62457-Chlamydomonas_euryale.AAC.1
MALRAAARSSPPVGLRPAQHPAQRAHTDGTALAASGLLTGTAIAWPRGRRGLPGAAWGPSGAPARPARGRRRYRQLRGRRSRSRAAAVTAVAVTAAPAATAAATSAAAAAAAEVSTAGSYVAVAAGPAPAACGAAAAGAASAAAPAGRGLGSGRHLKIMARSRAAFAAIDGSAPGRSLQSAISQGPLGWAAAVAARPGAGCAP